jgi:hypothetical protein
VVIGHFGRAHTPLAAKGFEFAQGTAKGSGIRSTGEEEIELIAGCVDTLAPQGDVFDGGPGWLLGQGEGDKAQENAEVEGGGGQSDMPRIPGSSFEPQLQFEGIAGEAAQGESFGEPGEQTPQNEAEGFEVVDGRFQVDGLLDSGRGGLGQREVRILAPGPGNEGQGTGPESLGEPAPGEPKQVAHGVDAQPGERLGEGIIGIEEIQGKGSQEGAFLLGREAVNRGSSTHSLTGDQKRNAARRGDAHHTGQALFFGPGQECRGKARLGVKESLDARCIEENAGLGKEETGCSRRDFGSGRNGESDIHQGCPGGLFEGRRGDTHLEIWAGGPGLGDGMGDANAG